MHPTTPLFITHAALLAGFLGIVSVTDGLMDLATRSPAQPNAKTAIACRVETLTPAQCTVARHSR